MDSLAVAIADGFLDECLCGGQLREVSLRGAVDDLIVCIARRAHVERSQTDNPVQTVLFLKRIKVSIQ